VLLQHYSEPAMMGRVMSMYTLAFLTASPLGYLQAGVVTDALGPRIALLSSGWIAAAIGLAAILFLKSVRDLE
jgi:hypothetical protein